MSSTTHSTLFARFGRFGYVAVGRIALPVAELRVDFDRVPAATSALWQRSFSSGKGPVQYAIFAGGQFVEVRRGPLCERPSDAKLDARVGGPRPVRSIAYGGR